MYTISTSLTKIFLFVFPSNIWGFEVLFSTSSYVKNIFICDIDDHNLSSMYLHPRVLRLLIWTCIFNHTKVFNPSKNALECPRIARTVKCSMEGRLLFQRCGCLKIVSISSRLSLFEVRNCVKFLWLPGLWNRFHFIALNIDKVCCEQLLTVSGSVWQPVCMLPWLSCGNLMDMGP